MPDKIRALNKMIALDKHPITDTTWLAAQKSRLDKDGALVLSSFLNADALMALQEEAKQGLAGAYFNPQTHNVYLRPSDPEFADDHIRNRPLLSSKGCICDDEIAEDSVLKQLYHHADFRAGLCAILGEEALHPYADPLSSVNIHYARQGEELNWHYDNSSFAVTLMISPARAGGVFEYARNIRNADQNEMGFEDTDALVSGHTKPQILDLQAGDLCLFRGRNSLHRVTPVEDESVRQLAVLAYNNSPGLALSETARQTFYGRLN